MPYNPDLQLGPENHPTTPGRLEKLVRVQFIPGRTSEGYYGNVATDRRRSRFDRDLAASGIKDPEGVVFLVGLKMTTIEEMEEIWRWLENVDNLALYAPALFQLPREDYPWVPVTNFVDLADLPLSGQDERLPIQTGNAVYQVSFRRKATGIRRRTDLMRWHEVADAAHELLRGEHVSPIRSAGASNNPLAPIQQPRRLVRR